MTDNSIEAIEAWFRRRGLPHFIEDYSARRDILTRASPFLTLVLLLEVFLLIEPGWPWWANALVVASGTALLAAIWAGVNLLRGRRGRSLFALPEQVGGVELLVFLLAPAAILAGNWEGAVSVVALNAVVLAGVYLTVSYALLPMLGWAGRRLVGDIRDVVGLFARALPLLLLIVTFLFINAEVWQLAGTLSGASLVAVIALFIVVTGVFLIFRLPAEIGELGTFASAERVAALVQGTPAGDEALVAGAILLDAPLRMRQRLNATLVVIFTLALQVVFVSALVGGFFLLLGIVALDSGLIASWTASEPRRLLELDGSGGRAVTVELLQVALFLAAFSGFYFTVSVVTNREYRDQFFEDVVREVRQAFAARAVYLGVLAEREGRGD